MSAVAEVSRVTSWWPDWRGQPAAVIASGPSAKEAGVDQLRGRVRTIVIKDSHVLAPWADVLYGCEAPFWKNEIGMPGFGGLKVAADPDLTTMYPDIKIVKIPDPDCDELLYSELGVIGAGGNSGFQAVNLAAQFGADRILLVGVDLQGTHWYGRNRGRGRNNPDELNFRRWKKAFDNATGSLQAHGIRVLNASPVSAIETMRKVTVAEALEEWGV